MAVPTAPSRQARTLGQSQAPSQIPNPGQAPTVLLSELAVGQSATIRSLAVEPGLRHRLQALGLHRGQRVQLLRRGWWAGPLHLRVGMTELMLRRVDAARVGIERVVMTA
jgi:ferrous iron transport protein A